MSTVNLIPSQTGTGCLRWVWYQQSLQGVNQSCWLQFNFLVNGDLTPGTTPHDFQNAYFGDFFSMIFNLSGLGGPDAYGYWTLNLPSGLHQARLQMPAIGRHAQAPPNYASGACLWLRSSLHNRHGSARVHWPFMYSDFFDGSRVSHRFKLDVQSLIHFYTTDWHWAGLTLRACVWSRALNVFSKVERVEVSRNLSRLRKRRPKWAKTNDALPFPTIW